MNLRDWWRYYSGIMEEFSFDPNRDFLSSLKLSGVLSEVQLSSDFGKLRGKAVTVVGNSPALRELLGSISDSIVMVADSAIDCYFSAKGYPDYIVTDLDGNIGKIMECASNGTQLAVHAHGDNIERIEKLSPMDGMNMIGTTQNVPLWNVHNFGGFTDGDRAAYLADAFCASRITLVGFDFNHPNPGKKSDQEIKLKKLKWARKLLENLADLRDREFTEGEFIEI